MKCNQGQYNRKLKQKDRKNLWNALLEYLRTTREGKATDKTEPTEKEKQQ